MADEQVLVLKGFPSGIVNVPQGATFVEIPEVPLEGTVLVHVSQWRRWVYLRKTYVLRTVLKALRCSLKGDDAGAWRYMEQVSHPNRSAMYSYRLMIVLSEAEELRFEKLPRWVHAMIGGGAVRTEEWNRFLPDGALWCARIPRLISTYYYHTDEIARAWDVDQLSDLFFQHWHHIFGDARTPGCAACEAALSRMITPAVITPDDDYAARSATDVS